MINDDDDEYCPPEPRIPPHGGIIRVLPGCPRLRVESGWIRSQRSGRERLVWLVYLIPRPCRRTRRRRRDFHRRR
jgi:hypothetical protein